VTAATHSRVSLNRPPTSLRVNGQTDLHQRRLYKVTRQQATSSSPSTSAHKPAAPWSSDRPPEEEETGSAVKQNRPLLAFFYVLQGVVYLTSGREGKRRRKQGRSARFWRCQRRHVNPRATSVPTRISAVPEAFPLQFLEF
jgi:hypothetical protein